MGRNRLTNYRARAAEQARRANELASKKQAAEADAGKGKDADAPPVRKSNPYQRLLQRLRADNDTQNEQQP